MGRLEMIIRPSFGGRPPLGPGRAHLATGKPRRAGARAWEGDGRGRGAVGVGGGGVGLGDAWGEGRNRHLACLVRWVSRHAPLANPRTHTTPTHARRTGGQGVHGPVPCAAVGRVGWLGGWVAGWGGLGYTTRGAVAGTGMNPTPPHPKDKPTSACVGGVGGGRGQGQGARGQRRRHHIGQVVTRACGCVVLVGVDKNTKGGKDTHTQLTKPQNQCHLKKDALPSLPLPPPPLPNPVLQLARELQNRRSKRHGRGGCSPVWASP